MLSETTRYIIHNPFNNHQPPTSNHIKSIQNALKQSVPRFFRGTQGTWFLMEFILVLDFRLPWHPPSQNTIKITNTHTLISKHHNILHQIYCNPKTKQFFFVGLRDWSPFWGFKNQCNLTSRSEDMTHRLPSSNCIDIQFSSPSIQVFTSNIQYSSIISST